MRCGALGSLLLFACAPPGAAAIEEAASSRALASRPPAIGSRVPAGAAQRETDAPPPRAVREAGGWTVDADGVLWSPSGARVIADVFGEPALLPDGAAVVAVLRAPGETELWLAAPGGGGRWLAPAAGPDESPTALPDGRVLFASGRTGVMSMWIADVRTDRVEQRTNVGLVVGGSRRGFVPPPHGAVVLRDDRAWWDDGYGARWSIALADEGAR